jgi:rabenosyn-5
LSIDGALDVLRPREMWKGVKGTLGPSGPAGAEEARKRGKHLYTCSGIALMREAAEHAIVKWEDDGDVKKCRICQ